MFDPRLGTGRRMTDIVDIIKRQHRQVDELLDQSQQEGADVLGLLRQVSDLLIPHSEAEESFVYPTIRDLDRSEGEEVKDGTAEHHHIEGMLKELLAGEPGSPGYDGKLAALIGELRHHVEEEEQDLLPVLSEQASAAERARLGERFLAETGQAGSGASSMSKQELYEKAKEQDVKGRSSMSKDELAQAVDD
jgi:hemerythrin-like domain-containing protein